MLWNPSPIWEGEDVYVVGGGPSLRGFDWDLIRGKKTIGCNSAFILGAEIIKIVIFADYMWWKSIGEEQLPAYGGIVVGCCPHLVENNPPEALPPWLLTMEREESKNGLSKSPTALGFNGNTGSLAIDLALKLGAKTVYLLGFDMKQEGDRPNWHDIRYEAGVPTVYQLFARQLTHVARDVSTMYPESEIINVSDVSELKVFPLVSLEEHFSALKGSK